MSVRELLVKYCHKVYEKEFVSAFDGNVSARYDSNSIIITPSAKCKGEVTENDFIIVDMNGNKIEGEGKISTEVKIHLLIYNNRPEVNSVFHCHPVYTTAMATIGETFNQAYFPELLLTLGKVPLCKYATPSTDELPDSMKPYVKWAWAYLLENHGAVTSGKNLKDAYYKMEKLEHAAKTLYVSKSMGRPKTIPRLKIKELYSIAEKSYGIKIDKENRIDY